MTRTTAAARRQRGIAIIHIYCMVCVTGDLAGVTARTSRKAQGLATTSQKYSNSYVTEHRASVQSTVDSDQ